MKALFVTTALILNIAACAQTADSSATENPDSVKSKPQFKLSINYNSALHYYGRTDSLRSTGVFPLAEFWITPEFYINAAPVFVNNKLQSFDYAGTVASAGYLHVTKKWITSLYVTKPFYEADANLVQSALQAQTGASITKLNEILNVNIGGDVKFSEQTDFGANFGLDHLVRKELNKKTILVVDPGVYMYMGTQRFTNTYTKKQANPLLPPVQQQVTESRFNILSYEASVPVILVRGKWMLLATPAYVIPENLITVKNRPDLSEQGKNMFYTTLGLKYTF